MTEHRMMTELENEKHITRNENGGRTKMTEHRMTDYYCNLN
jgi:hypothetical protein